MTSRSISLRIGLAVLAALAPVGASAHIGIGDTSGLGHGFAHPLSGIDHVLAMVAVGTFAANLGGRALWAVPLSFVALMLFGGALGIAGIALPFVEVGVALSVVVIGLAVAIRLEWPLTAAMALVGVFAIFHGHSHGTEMPLDAAGVQYALGFVAATGLLHLAGLGIGLGLGAASARYSQLIARLAGTAVVCIGMVFIGGLF